MRQANVVLKKSFYPDCLDLTSFLPSSLRNLPNPQTAIPKIAKDNNLTGAIEAAVRGIPTSHTFFNSDARKIKFIESESIHLVLTSPPYWTLKEYRVTEGQMGFIEDYEFFLHELDKVWVECLRVLVPGGRLVCVVGDVCISRRKNSGEHMVVPLHAAIQERCRKMGFKNLSPIIWSKISNAKYEAGSAGGGFLGKPYEPNAVIKNDIEFILMERKAGGYRNPSIAARVLSVIPEEKHRQWFQQIWTGLTGASTKQHPAPFPIELAERVVRMFSFAGDTVLDPFMGTATTNLAAAKWGRNSIGVEIDAHYFEMASRRFCSATQGLLSKAQLNQVKGRKDD